MKRVPFVTLILIAANLFAAFALLLNPDILFHYGYDPLQPGLRRALTSLFLHQNVFHLLGNLLFLAAVGVAVETVSGIARYLTVYFVSGLVGMLFVQLFGSSGDYRIVVGASGCIAGCAAYYTLRNLSYSVPIAPRLSLTVAWVSMGWLLLQVVGVFIHLGESATSTSYWAHLGGFAAGIALNFVFRSPDLGGVEASREWVEHMNAESPAAVAKAAAAHLERHPNDLVVWRERCDSLMLMEEYDEAASCWIQLLDLLPENEQHEALEPLIELKKLTLLSASRRTLLAERYKHSMPEIAKALLMSVIEGPFEDAQRPDALLALAALEKNESHDLYNSLLLELVDKYPVHPATDIARARGWLS